MIGKFGGGGSRGLFRETGNFVADGDLKVAHKDFFEMTVPIANFTGLRKVQIREDHLEFTVFLKRKGTGEKPAIKGGKIPD